MGGPIPHRTPDRADSFFYAAVIVACAIAIAIPLLGLGFVAWLTGGLFGLLVLAVIVGGFVLAVIKVEKRLGP